jgi:hypothetical protein
VTTELGAEDGNIADNDRGHRLAGRENSLPINAPTISRIRCVGNRDGRGRQTDEPAAEHDSRK